MKAYHFVSLVFFLIIQNLVLAQHSLTRDTNYFATDGEVRHILTHNNTTYVAGDFFFAGQQTGSLAKVDQNGIIQRQFPKVDGIVYAIESDGSGGWFIGGRFTRIGSTQRTNLAHIRADGTVNPTWNVSTNDLVRDIKQHNGKLYVAGDFETVNGSSQIALAVLNSSNGLLTSPTINVAGQGIYTTCSKLLVSNDILYILGRFSSIQGQSREDIGAVSLLNNQVQSLRLTVSSGAISTIEVINNTLYIGGFFGYVNNISRANLAAIDIPSSQVSSWNPSPNGSVNAIRSHGSLLYIGGIFTRVAGEFRNNLAAVDINNGQVNGWAPYVSSDVLRNSNIYDIAINQSKVYVGGWFTDISGSDRLGVAEIGMFDGMVKPFTANTNHNVYKLAIDGASNLIMGGNFSLVGAQVRFGLAAFDATTGDLKPWNPRITRLGRVSKMQIGNNKLYFAGYFTEVNGASRSSIAAVDLQTGQLLPWAPSLSNPNYYINDFTLVGNTIFMVGDFGYLINSSIYQSDIGAIDATTGQYVNWPARISYTPSKIAYAQNRIFVTGRDNNSINHFDEFDVFSGSVLNNLPFLQNKQIDAIQSKGNLLFVSGDFTHFMPGSIICNNFLTIDLFRNTVLTNFCFNNLPRINQIRVLDNKILMSSVLPFNQGTTSGRLAFMDLNDNNIFVMSSNINNNINDLMISGDRLLVGGNQTIIDGSLSNNLSAFQSPQILTHTKDKLVQPITGLKITPNPASDFFKVEGLESNHEMQALIYSSTGSLIDQQQISKEKSIINTSALANGLYRIVIGKSQIKFNIIR